MQSLYEHSETLENQYYREITILTYIVTYKPNITGVGYTSYLLVVIVYTSAVCMYTCTSMSL